MEALLRKSRFQLCGTSIALFLCMIACGDDESETIQNSELFGTWELVRVDGDVADFTLRISFVDEGSYFEFFEDGIVSGSDSGTWVFLNDTTVRITYDQGDTVEFEIISVNTDLLRIRDEDRSVYDFLKI